MRQQGGRRGKLPGILVSHAAAAEREHVYHNGAFLFKFLQGFQGKLSCGGGYPHESMYMLQHLFNNWFTNLDLDKMAAAAVCVGGVLLIVILLLQRLWDGGDEQ